MKKNSTDISTIDGMLEGKTCLITGANSGLGKALAIEMARRRANLVLACRRNYLDDLEEIKRLSGNPSVALRILNLSSLAQTSHFCDEIHNDGLQLDIVLFNAGMAASTNEYTEDGFSLLWQVNFLSNALITRRFLKDGVIRNSRFTNQKLENKTTSIPRIVYVSSSRHRERLSIDFEHFSTFPEFIFKDTFKVYGLSKLYLLTYAWELGRQLQVDREPEVSVFNFCPGAFRSRIGKNLGFLGNLVMSNLSTQPEQACWPGIYLACSPEMEGKTQIYYHKRNQEIPDPRATNLENMRCVWEKTEEILISRKLI